MNAWFFLIVDLGASSKKSEILVWVCFFARRWGQRWMRLWESVPWLCEMQTWIKIATQIFSHVIAQRDLLFQIIEAFWLSWNSGVEGFLVSFFLFQLTITGSFSIQQGTAPPWGTIISMRVLLGYSHPTSTIILSCWPWKRIVMLSGPSRWTCLMSIFLWPWQILNAASIWWKSLAVYCYTRSTPWDLWRFLGDGIWISLSCNRDANTCW